MSWLNATLSESVLSTVLHGMNTAQQVWTSLANHFASQSHVHLLISWNAIYRILNKEISLVWNLFIKPSYWLIILRLLASPLMMMIWSHISRVVWSQRFNPFNTSVSLASRDNPISFDDFQDELFSYELLLENQNFNLHSELGGTALYTPKSNLQKGKPKPFSKPKVGPGVNHQRGLQSNARLKFFPASSQGSFSQTFKGRPSCQICGKSGHNALDSYHRMDFIHLRN